MFRTLAISVCALAVFAVPVQAKRVARPFSVVEKVARAELVVVGKITGFDKDTMLPQYVGDPNKVAHKVAVVKIEKGLLGAEKMTEVKVAFLAPPKVDPNAPVRPVLGGFRALNLTEGQEGVFFLTKTGDFYTATPMMTPLDSKADDYKVGVEIAGKATAAILEPMKALKADKADDRYLAATALITKYRTVPDSVETETVKVAADETKLILKALAEGDWSKYDAHIVNGMQAFHSLALTEKDGWVAPVIANVPGAPPVDFSAVNRDAFGKWIDGPGAKYQINKIVAKAKK